MTGRLIATLGIWIILSIIIISLLTSATGAVNNADGATVFGIVFILALSAVFSTGAVWFGGARLEAEAVRSAKAKRHGRSRVERLIADLDDDEVYDLEALLLGRDSDLHTHRDKQPR